MTAPEIRWIENDMKVEMLALKMKKLRKEYAEKKPNALKGQIENYVNRKLKYESELLLKEQFSIISDSGVLLKNEIFIY